MPVLKIHLLLNSLSKSGMKKPFVIVLLLLIPVLLVAAGFYLDMDILYSVGAVVLIFYVIMTVIEKFRSGKNVK
jgi:hypothetical protein